MRSTATMPGLLAFWSDIDADYVERFREWHNCEHIPERIGTPGFVAGRRYRGIGDAPMFLMSYETASPDVLASEAYLGRVNDPTPWTREALGHFRNPSRNILRLLAERGIPPRVEAPYLHVELFNLPAEAEAPVVAWIADQWLPRLSRIAAVDRARLYAVDEEIAGILTSERQIYGGGPGQQKYLLWIETAAPDTHESAAWRSATEALADQAAMLGRRTDLFVEQSWLEFVLYPG